MSTFCLHVMVRADLLLGFVLSACEIPQKWTLVLPFQKPNFVFFPFCFVIVSPDQLCVLINDVILTFDCVDCFIYHREKC